MNHATLFSDFLIALGVPHTAEYSDARFAAMPFQSLFGLSKLLQEYGIETEGLSITDKEEITQITPPFLANTADGFVIVTSVTPEAVSYLSQGENETATKEEFLEGWDGTVLLAFPDPDAKEPSYAAHRRSELITVAKKWVLWGCIVLLAGYLIISNRLYNSLSIMLILLFDLCGLWLTYGLVQKTLKIKNRAADKVCGVLEKGGCDHVLENKASSFFGIFKWSEVGLTYFSVSIMALLIFPQYIGCLALCNLLCLPFTVWSIWYQKFRIKTWCTLCVSVQLTLWLLFFCYLGGGWLGEAFPISIQFFVLGVTYLCVLLAINKLMTKFDNNEIKFDDDENDTSTSA